MQLHGSTNEQNVHAITRQRLLRVTSVAIAAGLAVVAASASQEPSGRPTTKAREGAATERCVATTASWSPVFGDWARA